MRSTMQGPLSPWLSPATLRNLSDKLYEKRKAAALEVEQARELLNCPACAALPLRATEAFAVPGAGDQSAGCCW